MKNRFLIAAVSAFCLSLLVVSTEAQRPKPTPKAAKQIIFAVLDDGKSLEPLAHVVGGKLVKPVDGGDAENLIAAFNKAHYKPGTVYRLVFGGTDAGTSTVKSSDVKADCSKNMGTTVSKPAKTPLKGMVMALATNVPIKNKAAAFRRKPTADEKGEVDALVKKEFNRQKLTPTKLNYHNLTALDVNNDGKAEFVGTYWVEIDKLTRGMLFFIADKGENGKYTLTFSDYRMVAQKEVMGGDLKPVDEGVYHELLLDVFDYDGDGTAEIFTYVQSFEGSGFSAYRRTGGKWTRIYEGSNYHSAY